MSKSKIKLPKTPGVYMDRSGLPWSLEVDTLFETDKKGTLINPRTVYLWWFGDDHYRLKEVREHAPFRLMVLAESVDKSKRS